MTKAEKTKQFIIEKTAPIFNTKGYAGTSLNDMTDATGLTKGSIYGNFANKDEVALAAFDHNLGKLSNVIRQELEKKESARDKLLVYVRVYDDYLHFPFPDGGCPILNTAIEADDTHVLLKKKAKDAVMSWKNRVTAIIEKGIRDKEFSPSVNPRQIALSIIAMIEGGIMITRITGKLAYRSEIMKSVEKMIMDL